MERRLSDLLTDFRSKRALLRSTLDEHRRQLATLRHIRVAFEEAHLEIRSSDSERSRVEKMIATLSDRQKEVLRRVISGQANKLIAFEMGLSQKTVETHRHRVMRKLGADSLAVLVRLAVLGGFRSTETTTSPPLTLVPRRSAS